MPVEETVWDLSVPRHIEPRHYEELRAAFADLLRERLPAHKTLRRVVAWSPNGGCLYRPRAGENHYAVSYEVELAV